MRESIKDEFVSIALVDKLGRYARQLVQLLQRDLTAVASTGIALQANIRIPLTIDQLRPVQVNRNEVDFQHVSSDLPQVSTSFEHSMRDTVFFERWLDQPSASCRPLLLIAPFGCGKSVTLAQFALLLAGKLNVWSETPGADGPIPWVPFPVRLRDWSGDTSLWNYILSRAQLDISQGLFRSSDRLTEDELFELCDRGRLLPLFDGLDELPEAGRRGTKTTTPRSDAITEIRNNPSFAQRHLLSSRPEHGAESSELLKNATLHTLRELDQPAAQLHSPQVFAQHYRIRSPNTCPVSSSTAGHQ